MPGEEPAVEPQDAEAIEAFEAALATFTEKLNLLHIAGGSPSYATIATASVRPRLTSTGLNEILTGKRLPSLESLLEFVRVVSTPDGLDKPTAAKFRADSALVEEWRARWQDAKLLQRRATPANKRLRATVKQIHDNAVREAEALRTEAHAEAERIRTQAQQDADQIREQAHEAAPQPPWAKNLRAVLRTALRPAAAVMAVAGLATAGILLGDLTGTPGCGRGRAGISNHGQVAFAVKPEGFMTIPPGSKVPFSVAPPDTSSPTPESSPTPNTTPSPSTSPSPSPSPSKSGACTKSDS